MLDFFYAFMSTLGFGIIFNVRGKNLFYASIAGGLGWFVYIELVRAGYSDVISLFLGTIALSIASEICARLFKNPVTVYLICALIPLVPGSGMYYTIFEAVTGNYNAALTKGAQTIFNAGSIAVGVMFVSTISTLITRLNKKYKAKKLKLAEKK